MALQSSGTIRFSQINTELGRASNSTIGLDKAENGDYGMNQASQSKPNPANSAKISEWYGYNHSASSSATLTVSVNFLPNHPQSDVLNVYINGFVYWSTQYEGVYNFSVQATSTYRIEIENYGNNIYMQLQVIGPAEGDFYNTSSGTMPLSTPTYTLTQNRTISIYAQTVW
jgi:hypothetical protein